MSDLADALRRIDRKPYGFYKDLRGRTFGLGAYDLRFDHVQGDPFAAPSRLLIDASPTLLGLPGWASATRDARRASADYLQRAVGASLARSRRAPGSGRGDPSRRGSGKSGLLEIAPAGQEVFERSGVQVDGDGGVRLRIYAGLPAAGRRILGHAACELLTEHLPAALDHALGAIDQDALRRHVHAVEDQVALRDRLAGAGLVSFLSEGSVLPRRSGVDARPLKGAVPLAVPASLAAELEAPHAGKLRGLAVRRGVTLVVGGGYHGKSTLLAALALGVYDHVPGDGRDRCVSVADALTVRAEDGRSVRGVDLRPFIADLPLGRRTDRFDTDDASGSTSQAAAIVEALEAGMSALLVDEDTAATNFMIRDARMRRLVPDASEPITPFIDRVRQLWEERGVSSVLVVGGAGDYLDVADTVIQLEEYRPLDQTERARSVAASLPLGEAAPRAPSAWPEAVARTPEPASFDPRRGRRSERVRSVKTRAIEFGSEEIDVSLLFQLVDPAQGRFIGDALLELSRGLCDGRASIPDLLQAIEQRVDEAGLDALGDARFGDRARARRLEIACALNRLRSLRLLAPG